MINIRHHIASIIAIFLALGIGLIIGSTLISGETVDALEARLDAQEVDLDDTQGESDSLQSRVDELEELQARFELAAPEHVFAGRLAGESAMVVTAVGTSDETIQSALEVLGATSAVSVGVVTIDEPVSDSMIAELEAAVSQLAPITTTSTTVPAATTAAPSTSADPTPGDLPTLEELAEFLATTTTTASTTTTLLVPTTVAVADESAVVLQSLVGAGLASFVSADSEVPRSTVVLVVLDEGSDPEVGTSILALMRALNDSEQPRAVVASASADQPVVAAIRSDIELALIVPTVSHFDGVVGQLASVLALEDLSVPFVEHYGSGEGLLLLPPGEL